MRGAERRTTTMPEVHQVPDDDAGILFEEYLLRLALRDRLEAQQRLSEAVAMAIDAGFSWSVIGRILSVRPQGADGHQDLEQAS